MKINRNAKVELCTDQTGLNRLALSQCFLDTEEEQPYIVATDTYVLAVVQVEATKEEGGYITPETLKRARKCKGKGDVEIKLNGVAELADGSTIQRPKDMPPFLRWRVVIPNEDPNKLRVTLNADLLSRLQDALGALSVTLEIDKETPHKAIRVTNDTNKNFGAIMPIKLKQ